MAELIGEADAAQILQQTLDEEGDTDKLLTEISEGLSFEAEVAADAESDD